MKPCSDNSTVVVKVLVHGAVLERADIKTDCFFIDEDNDAGEIINYCTLTPLDLPFLCCGCKMYISKTDARLAISDMIQLKIKEEND